MASTSFEVDGLSEAVKAMSRFDKETGKAARDEMRAAAVKVQKAAQAKSKGRPGGGSYPRRLGMIGRSVTTKGAGINLRGKKYPWAWGAEFGARRAWVFGRVTTQGKLRRRQFPVWRGSQFVTRGRSGPGWIIQPTIRKMLPQITEEIADGMSKVLSDALTKAGVPR